MVESRGWSVLAKEDAQDMAMNFRDEIFEQLMSEGEASYDLYNDYNDGDSYHHKNHVDKSYSLIDAADLLDDLSLYEETDKGLWDGMGPRNAISVQAAYTYGNAVMHQWVQIIKEVNDNPILKDAIQDLANGDTDEDVVGQILISVIKGE